MCKYTYEYMWEQSTRTFEETNDFLYKFSMNSEEVKDEKNLIGGIDERQKNDLSIDAYILALSRENATRLDGVVDYVNVGEQRI